MKELKIKYVDHLPRLPEHLPPDVVEVYIGSSGPNVDISIVRRGFILSDRVMRTIGSRIRQLDLDSPRRGRPVAECVGLYPVVSAEWRRFVEDLLQEDDSWAFLVPSVEVHCPS
ncbi:MAG TPA: hypothetical protein VEV41_03110 [Terriglobales bacterium]|nr:hypothetical protein [Terriglobales bacterium]